jgi:hypothetical protein
MHFEYTFMEISMCVIISRGVLIFRLKPFVAPMLMRSNKGYMRLSGHDTSQRSTLEPHGPLRDEPERETLSSLKGTAHPRSSLSLKNTVLAVKPETDVFHTGAQLRLVIAIFVTY